VSSPPLSRRLLSPLLSTLHRAARILSGQGFPSSARGVLNAARGKEDRTRCRAAAGRLLSVASVSVKRRLRQRLDLLVAQCSAAVETGICRRYQGFFFAFLFWLFWFSSSSLPRFGFPFAPMRPLPWEEDVKRICLTSVRSPEARSWNFFSCPARFCEFLTEFWPDFCCRKNLAASALLSRAPLVSLSPAFLLFPSFFFFDFQAVIFRDS